MAAQQEALQGEVLSELLITDNDEVKAWFLGQVEQIMKKRVTPLNLIIENSPGQKWHPNDKPPPPVREEF